MKLKKQFINNNFGDKMKVFTKILSIIILSSAINCFAQKENISSNLADYKMVWADEFDYTGLPDSSKWNYDVAAPCWVNNEAQAYFANRLENSRVENGHLIIEARKDNHQNYPYSSARLITKGKGDWTYGRIEVKAKLPFGRGTWPAIWMLPTIWELGDKSWPDNGEIDIMEHVGYNESLIHASIHCNNYVWIYNTQKTDTLRVPDATSSFHVYAMEWDENQIKMFVDSTHYFTFNNEQKDWKTWPFYRDFHVILNIAIGGAWGGMKGIDDSIFPQKMEIDYVRVYQKK